MPSAPPLVTVVSTLLRCGLGNMFTRAGQIRRFIGAAEAIRMTRWTPRVKPHDAFGTLVALGEMPFLSVKPRKQAGPRLLVAPGILTG